MKQIFLSIFLCLVGLIGNAQVGNTKEQFDKANELYQKEHYSDAILGYKELLKEESEAPEIYFNLGNAYYKKQEFVEAVYNYEKALKLNPADKAAQKNLLDARKHLEDDIAIIHEYQKADFLHKVLEVLTVDQWAVLSTITVLIAFGLLIGYYVSQGSGKKRGFFTVSVVFFLFTVFSLYAAFFENNYETKEVSGIVFQQVVELKDAPKSTAGTILELYAGVKVYVLEENGLWIKVRLDNYEEGWIEKQVIKEI